MDMTINWLREWNERPEVQADIFLTDPKYDVFIRDTLAKCQRKLLDDRGFLADLRDKIDEMILDAKQWVDYDVDHVLEQYYLGKIDGLQELQERLDNYIQ
jgi:hypothetical protein